MSKFTSSDAAKHLEVFQDEFYTKYPDAQKSFFNIALEKFLDSLMSEPNYTPQELSEVAKAFKTMQTILKFQA